MSNETTNSIQTQIVINAYDEMLYGSSGLQTRIDAFKAQYPMWQDGGYTQELIENLTAFASALDEFLQAVDGRVKTCEIMQAKEDKTNKKQLETTETLTPVLPVLEKLEKLQAAMSKLVYSSKVVDIVKKNASHLIVYNQARKLIDDFVTPLFENDTIFGLVRALVLKRPTLELLYSKLGSMGSNLGPLSGVVAGIDGTVIAACLSGLKKCHLEGIKNYTYIETLFKVMLQQLMTPSARDQIDADIPEDHNQSIKDMKMELDLGITIDPSKEIENKDIDPNIPLTTETINDETDQEAKKNSLRMAITWVADKKWNFVNIYTQAQQEKIQQHILLFRKCIDKIPEATSLNPVWTELRKTLARMPRNIRHYLQNELYESAKLEGLTPPKWVNPLKNRKSKSDKFSKTEPLIIHFAGTGVSSTINTDTIGNLLAEYNNFFIEGGSDDEYWGSDGEKKLNKILENLVTLKEKNQLPSKLILTGFSRGAAAQIELANKIHKKFNVNQPKENWITIEMFLIDPAYGTFDFSTASTQTKHIPACVDTLNILYADDPAPETDEVMDALIARNTTQRKHYELISEDPSATTIKTLTLQGKHKELGLTRAGKAEEIACFVDELGREFLDNSGCMPAPFSKSDPVSVSVESPAFDGEYLNENIISAQQNLSVGYSSSDTLRFINGSLTNNKSAEFSRKMGQLANPVIENHTAENQYYETLLNKISHDITHGHFVSDTMSKMYKKIEQYNTSLKTEHPQDPKQVFLTIKEDAETAIDTWSPSRKVEVQHFYENIAKTVEPDFSAIAIRESNTAKQKDKEQTLLTIIKEELKAEISKAKEQQKYEASFIGFAVKKTSALFGKTESVSPKEMIASCEKIITKITELQENAVINPLKELNTFLEKENKQITPKIAEGIKNVIVWFQQEERKTTPEQEGQRSARFDHIADTVVNTVKEYEQYSQDSFLSRNSDNLKTPAKVEAFVTILKNNTHFSAAEKLEILKKYIGDSLHDATQRHESGSVHQVSTSTLRGYQIFKKTKSHLVTLLQRAQNQMAVMNSDALIPPMDTDPIASQERQDRYRAYWPDKKVVKINASNKGGN